MAQTDDVRLMLIASRNQVEAADIGTGYVPGYSTESFAADVRRRCGRSILICRDHGGPYFRDDEVTLSQPEAEERASVSLARDVEAGFDLVHVDWSRAKGDRLASTRVAVEAVVDASDDVLCEVGTDEADGGVDTVEQVETALARFSDLRDRIEFFTARTGSAVRERFQVGFFERHVVGRVAAAITRQGLRFKEHNVDYVAHEDLVERGRSGVDAVNVAPELGVVQTSTVLTAGLEFGVIGAVEDFCRRCDDSGKWRKWQYGRLMSPRMRAMVCGHYNFGSSEYARLVAEVSDRCELHQRIEERLMACIRRVARSLAAGLGQRAAPTAPSKFAQVPAS